MLYGHILIINQLFLVLKYIYCCGVGVAPQDGESFASQKLNTRCQWYVPTRMIQDYHRGISAIREVITANILFQILS